MCYFLLKVKCCYVHVHHVHVHVHVHLHVCALGSKEYMNRLEDKYFAGECSPFSGANSSLSVAAEYLHQPEGENLVQQLEQDPPPLKKKCTRNKGDKPCASVVYMYMYTCI